MCYSSLSKAPQNTEICHYRRVRKPTRCLFLLRATWALDSAIISLTQFALQMFPFLSDLYFLGSTSFNFEVIYHQVMGRKFKIQIIPIIMDWLISPALYLLIPIYMLSL